MNNNEALQRFNSCVDSSQVDSAVNSFTKYYIFFLLQLHLFLEKKRTSVKKVPPIHHEKQNGLTSNAAR